MVEAVYDYVKAQYKEQFNLVWLDQSPMNDSQALAVARNVRQPGVVLIGDAYQTSCPAAGTGVSRLLTDVERLAARVPAWMRTPGMDAAKIASFYDDPVKAAMDAQALGMAGYRRAFTVDTRLAWRARRQAQFLRRRLLNAIDTLSPPLAARLRALRA